MTVLSIALSNGMVAIVDAADYERLAKFRWHPAKGRQGWYAARMTSVLIEGCRRTVCRLMHRAVLDPDDQVPGTVKCAHWNHNGLDNRRENLLWLQPRGKRHGGVPPEAAVYNDLLHHGDLAQLNLLTEGWAAVQRVRVDEAGSP